ncbi:MAG TPA: hypothetical protein VIO14_13635 [Dehalococcoidia bacterium]
MSKLLALQAECLIPLPERREMATLNIGVLDVLGYAPGGTAVVSVNIINIQSQKANLFICLAGC